MTKKRGEHPDERIKIDAEFTDALRALLGVDPDSKPLEADESTEEPNGSGADPSA